MRVAKQQPYMGEEIPLSWHRFDEAKSVATEKMMNKEQVWIYFLDLSQSTLFYASSFNFTPMINLSLLLYTCMYVPRKFENEEEDKTRLRGGGGEEEEEEEEEEGEEEEKKK